MIFAHKTVPSSLFYARGNIVAFWFPNQVLILPIKSVLLISDLIIKFFIIYIIITKLSMK